MAAAARVGSEPGSLSGAQGTKVLSCGTLSHTINGNDDYDTKTISQQASPPQGRSCPGETLVDRHRADMVPQCHCITAAQAQNGQAGCELVRGAAVKDDI